MKVMKYYRDEQRYINTYTMSILLYLLEHNGREIGFRGMVARMRIGSATLRKYMNELIHAGLVREEFIGNTSVFTLTDKGLRIAEKIKDLLDEVGEKAEGRD